MFGLRRRPRRVARIPAGQRIYAVGDIHGREDLLRRMGDLIAEDMGTAAAGSAVTGVLIGDYVDRGPSSAGVLKVLAEGQFPVPLIALRGNHEEMLLSFLDKAEQLDAWRRYGGIETLHSFGIDAEKARHREHFFVVQSELRAAIPERVKAFLGEMRLSHSVGDYFFCHAGVRPGIPLEAQSARDLLWIRDDFVHSRADHGMVIVHGHTPVEQPELLDNRINIDTGAYLSDRLSCVVLEEDTRRILQT